MANVEHQLATLEAASPATLREQWTKLTGEQVPRISPALLRLALAYEIQARAYGGLSRATQQRLKQLAAAKTRTTPALPGTRLVREWNGTTHVVLIGEDNAIRWNEREWRSLSEVARAITGTRWSGPAFFGLKRRAAA
ncbi:DUF2924 domain-containing protein [Sphingomonas sp. M1-B02]|uniref:DUF2924 domain-containing protein n=1 Tax=Sphingomonas sp. M1-B02 TaxID=3114300 RepID=UPI0022409335|nr:DUF2924 domain-containing protein [Sphingomonas sp. S6-11]UZK67309.1 DUF2924 domain-containing protein [Sphingomonas sp. S6-11]